MSYCTACGNNTDIGDQFCSACGYPTSAVLPQKPIGQPAPVAPTNPMPGPRRALVMGALIIGSALAFVGFFGLGSKGCSSVEGTVVANGKSPLGDFSFTPQMCRSGQLLGFFGAELLGDNPNDGRILVVNDVANKGKLIKVELPGSCKSPDFEECTVIEVTENQCERFDMVVKNTNTTVNDVRAVEGHLRVTCDFPEGGSLKGDLTFSTCH